MANWKKRAKRDLRIFRLRCKSLWGDRKARLQLRLDLLLEKYGITNPDIFREQGLAITSPEEKEAWEEGYITPLFERLFSEFDQIAKAYETVLTDELQRHKAKLLRLKKEMEGEYGKLGAIIQQIKQYEATEKELSDLEFPEQKLLKVLKDALDELKKKIEDSLSDSQYQDNLLKVVQQKEKSLQATQDFQTYRSLLGQFDSVRLSNLFPPKKSYFKGMILVCSLLFLAEISLSMTIFNATIDTNFQSVFGNNSNAVVNFILAAICSIMASVALAIVLKKMIESFLYKSIPKAITFWLMTSLILFLLIALFSSERIGGVRIEVCKVLGVSITQKGIFMGFYSMLFALSGAFLFREAAYLSHLYTRVYGHSGLRKLEKRRLKATDRCRKAQEEAEDMEARIQHQIDELRASAESIRGQIESLLKQAFTLFRQGCLHSMIKLVRSGKELAVSIAQKIFYN